MNLPQATCTVVIPCYNGEQELARGVASVQAQTYRDFHLVLVDDASTDGTLRRCTAWPRASPTSALSS